MEYADKTIKCEKCEEEFIFPCGEQKFFEEKGFAEPRKCPKCRGKENVTRPNENTYPIECSKCKKSFHVTFNPKEKPVLCFDCFNLDNKK